MIAIDRIDLCQGGQKICQVGPWEIQRGECWWVRGPNGCGKSTLLRVLAGDLWPAPGQHELRRYHFDEAAPTWSPLAAKGRVTLLTPERQNRYLHQDWDLTAAEVDEALVRFAEVDPECAELVKLKYFVGMSREEIAGITGESTRTLRRRWAYARSWLHDEIRGGDD